jgi:hypothetical protein
VDQLAEANVLEKHAVSVFIAEVTLTLKMEIACFFKTLASTNQSTWQLNSKECHQNCHSYENLKSPMQRPVFN